LESIRFYRLYNARTKKFLPWRCYSIKAHAHLGAMMELRWAAVGEIIEVVDFHRAKSIAQYKRELNGLAFHDLEKYETHKLAA